MNLRPALSRPRLIPTARAMALVIVVAPAALIIGALSPAAWVAAPLLGALVLALVLIDGALAGPLVDLHFSAQPEVEVGSEAAFEVTAAFGRGQRGSVDCAVASDARLLRQGRGEQALVRQADGIWSAALPYVPGRRGTGMVDQLWLKWSGPLGLGARQVVSGIGQAIRVTPNLGAVRSPALQAFLRNAEFGLIARRIRGEGAVFEALAEYQPGMDRRRIDWKSSARHSHLYAKEMEAERNNQIVFAFDCGQAMCEPVAGLARIDRAVSAALAAAFVALKGGDRVALFGFAARPEIFTPFVTDTRDFPRLQSAAAGLDYHAQEPNFTLALATLAGRLARRSLIVVFSDFSDPTSAELMVESIGRLTSRHLVLFVTLADEELDTLAIAPPDAMSDLAMAVTADALLRQRALVLLRLRQIGVDVIEAAHDRIGTQLIDSYLAIKRKGAIG